ncbi:MAG: Cof-type HAD-IIB family hydrolase [Chitinivibrionales bacterium]|nr:Cof-type HAD-IIB family hydrolase [Chitinivibrionales bacterium]MBD3357692.1 Cof-type HAD-IIB family hydrolase [Chitinivibrionales bacterium]
MPPKLLAFDLDGTLLTSDKKLSKANRDALVDMAAHGSLVTFASGRLGSSMMRVAAGLDIDLAMLTLNGAAVYSGHVDKKHLVYQAPLAGSYADQLISFAQGRDFALNYYIDDRLYAIKNPMTARWIDLYYQQTRTDYVFLDDFGSFTGRSPSKVIFVGAPNTIDEMEEAFRAQWDGEIYICRTWDHYLEFLSPQANKGKGLRALATALGVDLADVVAFGDAENDIPMLKACGMGVAMQNAPDPVKEAADYVSEWTNDEDGVAKEWERLKAL